MTTPFLRPGCTNRGPNRPISVAATLLARCSWSMETLTRSPRRPDGVQRRREEADIELAGFEARGHGSLDDLPASRDVTAEHPRLESLLPDRDSRMAAPTLAATTVGGDLRPLKIGRIDQPRAADLTGWQDPQPDASVDRHVVDPKEIGRLVQAEMAGRVRGGQPASVPGNSCEASVDFATRLSMGSALSSTLPTSTDRPVGAGTTW